MPTKPNAIIDLLFKVTMLFILVLMSLATMRYSIFHVVSIFYSMAAIISANIIIKDTLRWIMEIYRK